MTTPDGSRFILDSDGETFSLPPGTKVVIASESGKAFSLVADLRALTESITADVERIAHGCVIRHGGFACGNYVGFCPSCRARVANVLIFGKPDASIR